MAFGARHSRALVLGASAFSFALMSSSAAFTQALETEAVTRTSEQKKQKQAKRQQAKPQQDAQAAAPVMNARAQIGAAPVQSLDTITVAASKTEERAIDALAPVSVVTLEQIQGRSQNGSAIILYNIPGVSVQDRGDEPSTSSTSAACRISAASPSLSTARGRTISAPATTRTARSSSIRNWLAASISCAVRPPISTARARSAAWRRSAPRTSKTSCVPASAGVSTQDRSSARTMAAALGSVFGGVHADPERRCVRRRHLQHAGELQGRHRLRDRQYRQPDHGRPCQAHGTAG